VAILRASESSEVLAFVGAEASASEFVMGNGTGGYGACWRLCRRQNQTKNAASEIIEQIPITIPTIAPVGNEPRRVACTGAIEPVDFGVVLLPPLLRLDVTGEDVGVELGPCDFVMLCKLDGAEAGRDTEALEP